MNKMWVLARTAQAGQWATARTTGGAWHEQTTGMWGTARTTTSRTLSDRSVGRGMNKQIRRTSRHDQGPGGSFFPGPSPRRADGRVSAVDPRGMMGRCSSTPWVAPRVGTHGKRASSWLGSVNAPASASVRSSASRAPASACSTGSPCGERCFGRQSEVPMSPKSVLRWRRGDARGSGGRGHRRACARPGRARHVPVVCDPAGSARDRRSGQRPQNTKRLLSLRSSTGP